MSFPTLTTQNIILNEIKNEDANDIYNIFSCDKVTKFYDLESFTTQEQAEQLIDLIQTRYNKSLGIRWAIRLSGSSKCIGTCGFNSWNEKNNSSVIGYDLNSKYWRQGIITQSLHCIIDAAFNAQLSFKTINRIQADTVIGNRASEAVLKKTGFVEEGTLRQSGFWNNKYHDLKCFSLLNHEFNKN